MIKTGIIGSKDFCNFTINNLMDVRGLRLVGLCEPTDEYSGISLAAKHNTEYYRDSHKLIKDIDALIAMPPMSGPDDVSFYVRNSKHVFFELSTEFCKSKAKKLSAIIDEADVKVQVGFHHRFNNTFLAAKPFIKKPKFIQSSNYKKFDASLHGHNVLLDMLINDIDIVLSVVNSDVKSVIANAASIFPGATDVINVRIEFMNACVAQLTAGLIATENSRKFGFYCEEDFINLDLYKNKAWLVKKQDPKSDIKLFQHNVGDLNVETISVKPNNKYSDEFNSFAKSIINDLTPEVSIDTTLRTLSVMQMVKERIKLATCA